MSRLLDRDFKYTPAASTDIRKLFRKERAKLKAEAEKREANAREAEQKLAPLKRRA